MLRQGVTERSDGAYFLRRFATNRERLFLAHDGKVLVVGGIPDGLVLRLVFHQLNGVGDDLAHLPDVADDAGGLGLHHDVADGGAFLRAGEHGGSRAVGGELVEELVERTAADDVEYL